MYKVALILLESSSHFPMGHITIYNDGKAVKLQGKFRYDHALAFALGTTMTLEKASNDVQFHVFLPHAKGPIITSSAKVALLMRDDIFLNHLRKLNKHEIKLRMSISTPSSNDNVTNDNV